MIASKAKIIIKHLFCLFFSLLRAKLLPTLLKKLCCVGLAVKFLNNYWQRKSARTLESEQKASNKFYTVLQ
jgi:hypothetical protein